jgi:Cu/Ag efflux pump CusA
MNNEQNICVVYSSAKAIGHCRLPSARINAQNRVEELVPARAPLALRIYDEDLTVADRISAEIKLVLGGVPEQSLARRQSGYAADHCHRGSSSRRALRRSADEILEIVPPGIGGKAVSVILDGTDASFGHVRMTLSQPCLTRSNPSI